MQQQYLENNKKQKIIAFSNSEVDNMGCIQVVKEATWLHSFFNDVGKLQKKTINYWLWQSKCNCFDS